MDGEKWVDFLKKNAADAAVRKEVANLLREDPKNVVDLGMEVWNEIDRIAEKTRPHFEKSFPKEPGAVDYSITLTAQYAQLQALEMIDQGFAPSDAYSILDAYINRPGITKQPTEERTEIMNEQNTGKENIKIEQSDVRPQYLSFNSLSEDQRRQADARFSGYKMEEYRYELGTDKKVLSRKPERDFKMGGTEKNQDHIIDVSQAPKREETKRRELIQDAPDQKREREVATVRQDKGQKIDVVPPPSDKQEGVKGNRTSNRDVPDIDLSDLTKETLKEANQKVYKSKVFHRTVMVDNETSLDVYKASAAKAAVQLAQDKGWDRITVAGSEKIRQQIWQNATAAGIKVRGYEPTAKDHKVARAMQSKLEKSTSDQKTASITPEMEPEA